MRDMMERPAQLSDELVFLHGAVVALEAQQLPLTAENVALVTQKAPWFIRDCMRKSDGVTGRQCGEVLHIH